MLMIRLSRFGKKKQPTYRLIVSEKQKDPWGDNLEVLGNYNPRTEPKTVALKKDRIEYWISKGAQCSATVHNLLVNEGVVKGPKRRVVQPRKKPLSEEEKKAQAAAAAAEAKPKEEKPADAAPEQKKVA